MGRGRGGRGRCLDREDSVEEPAVVMSFPPPVTPQPTQDSTTALVDALQIIIRNLSSNQQANDTVSTREAWCLWDFKWDDPQTFKGMFDDLTVAQLRSTWEIIRPGGEISWTEFKEAFAEVYYLKDIQIRKHQEFTQLTQRGRSITTYARDFAKLKCFILDLVFTDYKTTIRFVLGLDRKIRNVVEVITPTTHAAALRVARAMEGTDGSNESRSSTERQKRPRDWDDCPCVRCGKDGHLARDCPRSRTNNVGDQQRPLRIADASTQNCPPAIAYASTSKDTKNLDAAVIGTLFVLVHFALILYDSGSTHLFISTTFVSQANLVLEPLLQDFLVATLPSVDMVAAYRVRNGRIIVSGVSLDVDLMVVDMTVYDLILGMDWLAENHACIDYHMKEVIFTPPLKTRFKFKGTSLSSMPKVILMMKVKKLVQHEVWAILASVVKTKKEGLSLTTLPIVNEFSDVFPEDLPGIPPT
ncbi:uncharacterized protein LOC111439271 [Cucurbita moschata]|uniref:Uncharacterized protein LOC111439271 n=1 Tax=Cucurbita moschata TaxID=3662 RepID=A0A6J1F351_CUCMO|nr:uncharacterized protein LOC111439271 [Cucurbita moschata]